MTFMLKGLKGLFIYEKPSKSDFEFAEDPSESAAWNQYRNKEKNRTQQQNDQSVNADQRQAEVQNKLLQILKGSQEQQSTTEPKENEKSCNNSQEKEMDSAAGGQADENMEEPEKNGNKKDDTTDSGAETGESQKQNDEKQGNADPIEKKQKDGKNLKQDQKNQEKRLNKRPISPLPLERLIKNKAPAKQEEDDNQGQEVNKQNE